MQLNEKVAIKKEWATPSLTLHGNVETITHGSDKKYGGADGYTFSYPPIYSAS